MSLKRRNPKTKKVLEFTGSEVKVRLLSADRAFLRDLSRLQILSEEIANKNHYCHLKGGSARSLGRLARAGVIRRTRRFIPGQGVTNLYQFANQKVAKAWGGELPEIGAKRNEFHELITSGLYFQEGRPEDFRLANRMTDEEISAFNGHRPDAVFTDPETGRPVAVEADSGHYNRKQIRAKLAKWQGHKQVWGQPENSSAHVPKLPEITIHVVGRIES
ncbi:MAG: hypothetical protein ACE5F7_05025 [Nitrospiria bacterium]